MLNHAHIRAGHRDLSQPSAEALVEPLRVGLDPGDQPEYERDLAFVRGLLDEATFQARWNEGRTISLEQAVAYALELGRGSPNTQGKIWQAKCSKQKSTSE